MAAGIKVFKTKPLKTEKLIPLAVILGTLGVIFFSPIANQFTYPSAGGDGASYLLALQDGLPIRNYGILPIQWLQDWGLTPLQALSFYYYSIISLATVITWFFLRRFGLNTAIIGTPLVMLGNWGVWELWFSGSILGIGGLMIFALGSYYLISKAKRYKHHYWYIPLIFMLIGGVLFHKASGIILLSTCLIYSILVRNYILFILTSSMGLFGVWLWANDNDLINHTVIGQDWLSLAILTYVVGFIVVAWLKVKAIRDMFYKQPSLMQLLLIQVIVLSLATLIKNPFAYRMVLDITTISMIFIAILIARGLIYLPERYQSIAIAICLIIPLLGGQRWLSNYTAIQDEDIQVFNRVNALAQGRPATIALGYGEANNIVQLYLDKNIRFASPDEADIVIVRNNKRDSNERNGFVVDTYTSYLFPNKQRFVSD